MSSYKRMFTFLKLTCLFLTLSSATVKEDFRFNFLLTKAGNTLAQIFRQMQLYAFFNKQHQAEIGKKKKKKAKAKKHPEADFLLFENYSLSSSMLSSKNNSRYYKKCTRTSASALIRLHD